jgi:SAM-dependent methyltransferase
MSVKNVKNYEALSLIYDEVMSNINYDLWIDLITVICNENNIGKSAKILEIGGGTGILGQKLNSLGFSYFGSDYSFDMARAAKNKGLDFVCADCRNLPFNCRFDIVLFLFDGINYIFKIDEFIRTYEQAHSVLKNEGLFLFDITTQANSLNNFYNYRESFADKNYAYIRDSYYDKKNNEQHNDFDIFIKEKKENYRRYSEKHCQKVHAIDAVIASIPKELFNTEGIWGDFNRKRYDKKSQRVHFLLRKK